jgi:hypothetical protein
MQMISDDTKDRKVLCGFSPNISPNISPQHLGQTSLTCLRDSGKMFPYMFRGHNILKQLFYLIASLFLTGLFMVWVLILD